MKALSGNIKIIKDQSLIVGALSSGNIKVQSVNDNNSILEPSNKRTKLNNGNYATHIISNTIKNKQDSFQKVFSNSIKDTIEVINTKNLSNLPEIRNDEVIYNTEKSSLSEFGGDEMKSVKNDSSYFISLQENEDDRFEINKQFIVEQEFISVNGYLDEANLPEQTVTEVIEGYDLEDGTVRVKSEPVDTDVESSVLIKVPESTTTDAASKPEEQSSPSITQSRKRLKIDKDDARSRIHFVKYMKKDGKTVKKFECGICLKEFVHQYTLMRHLPTHTDERNYRCNECGKAFRQMSTLSQHKATHSQSRPYVCDVCRKTFSRVSTLISHKKTHTDQKQHICHICNKAFHQKGNLKNHIFTHSNERPYKCELCGRGFNQSSNLQCHKIKAHADDTVNYQFIDDKYKCKYCPESYRKRAQLRRHEEFLHGMVCSTDNRTNNAILKKKKIGNVRIIKLPNGDKTFQEVTSDNFKSKPVIKSKIKTGILIDPIDTKAMHQALAAGRIPFALLKPTKGVPVVVKVQFAAGSKHMLVPASADELRIAGKFTVSNPGSGAKAVQIKVPVVATINQRVGENGQIHMDVEAPEDEEVQNHESQGTVVSNLKTNVTSSTDDENFVLNPAIVSSGISEPLIAEEDEEQTLQMPILAVEDRISISAAENLDLGIVDATETGLSVDNSSSASVNLLPSAVNLTQDQECIKNSLVNLEGVQYLKQSCTNEGKFAEYEIVAVDDPQATHVISQQGEIAPIKVDESGGTMTMDQDHISVLMDALHNAGYEISSSDTSGENHIIINADGNAVMVNNQPVQMVIDGNIQAVVSTEGMVEQVGASSINLVVQKVPEILSQNPAHDIS